MLDYKKEFKNLLKTFKDIQEILSSNSLLLESCPDIRNEIIKLIFPEGDIKEKEIFSYTNIIQKHLNEIRDNLPTDESFKDLLLRSTQNAERLANSLGFELLRKAISNNDLKFVEDILTTNPELVDRVNDDGWGPIHICAQEGKPEILQILIERYGADINQKTEYSYTPIHIAAKYNNIACLIELLRQGADLTLVTRGQEDVVDFLAVTHTEIKDILDSTTDQNLHLELHGDSLTLSGDIVHNVVIHAH